MAWLKTVGCDCDCGPDPCTDGCCILSDVIGGHNDRADNFDVTGQFLTDRYLIYSFIQEDDAETLFEIHADGVLVVSEGCVAPGVLVGGSVLIPAGTVTITVVVDPTYSCAPPHVSSYYVYAIECD